MTKYEQSSIEKMIELCNKHDASTQEGLTLACIIERDLNFLHKFYNEDIIYKMIDTYFSEAKKYEHNNI